MLKQISWFSVINGETLEPNPTTEINELMIEWVTEFKFLGWRSVNICHGIDMRKNIKQDIKITQDCV